MIGTAFSVLIRMELSNPGTQILNSDHQLFNVIISAHAFIMSAPSHFNEDCGSTLQVVYLSVVRTIFNIVHLTPLFDRIEPNKTI